MSIAKSIFFLTYTLLFVMVQYELNDLLPGMVEFTVFITVFVDFSPKMHISL